MGVSPVKNKIKLAQVQARALVLVFSLGLSACGQGQATLTWVFPSLSLGSNSSLLTSPDLYCNADLFVGAEDREARVMTDSSFIAGGALSLIGYETGGSNLLTNTLASSLRKAVTVDPGGTWRLVAQGWATLKATDTSAAGLSDIRVFFSTAGGFNLFAASDWTCPVLTRDYWANLGSGVYLDTLLGPSSAVTNNSRVILPIYGESAPKTVAAGQVTQVELPVQVARVPFGLYSKTTFVGEPASGDDYAGFDGVSGAASAISEDAISPFYLLKLVDLNSRLSFTPSSGPIKVFPIVRNVDTGVLWRGPGEANLAAYESDPFHLYPLPGRRFDITLAFVCLDASGCSVILSGESPAAPMPIGAILFLSRRVDFNELSLGLYASDTAHQFQANLEDLEWQLSYAQWDSPPDALTRVATPINLSLLLNGR